MKMSIKSSNKSLEQMKMVSCLFLILLTACSGTAVNPPNPSPASSPSPTGNPIHALGQLVEVKGLTIAMIQVAYSSGQLQLMFAAKNTGSEVVSVSPVLLSATTGTGVNLKWVPCLVTSADNQKKLSSASPFSGNLQPGEILKGTICWDGATPQNGNQVGYAPGFGKPAVAIWDVSTAGQADVPALLAANTFIWQRPLGGTNHKQVIHGITNRNGQYVSCFSFVCIPQRAWRLALPLNYIKTIFHNPVGNVKGGDLLQALPGRHAVDF
jgi:hypothetical protein